MSVMFILKRALTVIFLCAFTGEVFADVPFSSLTVDARTGKVLYQKDADGLRHPASLTKMMTLYVLFQDLKSGRIKRTTQLRVSRRAAAMAPSKLGLKPGSTISVDDAIKALVTKSANDVAATVGENLGGTESNFAARMTRVARSIGMSRSTFYNASGLPNSKQYTTARDMATLGLRLMRDYPQYYPYFRTTSFQYRGQIIKSHNRLVGRFSGTDGIKTGYTNASGYNLVTSTRRGDKRLVGVVLGGRSTASRNTYMMVMLEKMFAKAANGSTVAALAGSSKGVINPLAVAESKPVKAEILTTSMVVDDNEMAAASAQASQGAVENGSDEDVAETASTGEPTVLQADLAPAAGLFTKKKKSPEKLPFAVKSAASEPTKLTTELSQSWNIQIGAFPNKGDAQAKLTSLRGGKVQELAGKPAFTVAIKSGSKVLYRARFAGFDEASAKQVCAQIAKLGDKCVTVSPQS